MEELPKEWSQHKTKEGKVYYYNSNTKKSSWSKPIQNEQKEKPVSFQNDGSFMDMVRSMNKNSSHNASSDENVSSTEIKPTPVVASSVGTASPEKCNDKSIQQHPQAESNKEKVLVTELTEEDISEANGLKRKIEGEDGSRGSVQSRGKVKNSRFKAKPQEEKQDPAQEYLRQVQQLQDMDKGTDSTGGKWLVR